MNGTFLDNLVPYIAGQSGPDRMYTLDSKLVQFRNLDAVLNELTYFETHKAYQKPINAIIVERHRTLEWIEYLRRQDVDDQSTTPWSSASSESTFISLTPS